MSWLCVFYSAFHISQRNGKRPCAIAYRERFMAKNVNESRNSATALKKGVYGILREQAFATIAGFSQAMLRVCTNSFSV